MPKKSDIQHSHPLPAGTPLRERLVVGVSGVAPEEIVVACQDGAVFTRCWPGEWQELPPIPQTPRWYQTTGAQMDASG